MYFQLLLAPIYQCCALKLLEENVTLDPHELKDSKHKQNKRQSRMAILLQKFQQMPRKILNKFTTVIKFDFKEW